MLLTKKSRSQCTFFGSPEFCNFRRAGVLIFRNYKKRSPEFLDFMNGVSHFVSQRVLRFRDHSIENFEEFHIVGNCNFKIIFSKIFGIHFKKLIVTFQKTSYNNCD